MMDPEHSPLNIKEMDNGVCVNRWYMENAYESLPEKRHVVKDAYRTLPVKEGCFNVKKNSKDQLAKLMATEDITVRHSTTAKTASFDVKGRVLTLPNWEA
jgi:hypothetical protein